MTGKQDEPLNGKSTPPVTIVEPPPAASTSADNNQATEVVNLSDESLSEDDDRKKKGANTRSRGGISKAVEKMRNSKRRKLQSPKSRSKAGDQRKEGLPSSNKSNGATLPPAASGQVGESLNNESNRLSIFGGNSFSMTSIGNALSSTTNAGVLPPRPLPVPNTDFQINPRSIQPSVAGSQPSSSGVTFSGVNTYGQSSISSTTPSYSNHYGHSQISSVPSAFNYSGCQMPHSQYQGNSSFIGMGNHSAIPEVPSSTYVGYNPTNLGHSPFMAAGVQTSYPGHSTFSAAVAAPSHPGYSTFMATGSQLSYPGHSSFSAAATAPSHPGYSSYSVGGVQPTFNGLSSFSGAHRSSNPLDFTTRYNSTFSSTISTDQIAARHVMSKELPTFSGNPEEWPMFYSNFVQSTERCGFTDQENLIRLQRSLKGKALEAVRGKLMVPQTLPVAIENLRMLYGQPEVILQNMQRKLSSEPTLRPERFDELINFSLSVQNYCATVVAFGLNDYLRDPMLLSTLVEKLPCDLKREWGRFQFPVSISDLTVFDRWLYDIARCTSAVSSISSSLSKPADTKQPESKNKKQSRAMVHNETSSETPSEKPVKKCPRCTKDHYLSDCEEFKKLTRDDRWTFVKEKGLCQNCFSRHHVRNCRIRRLCGVDGCRLRHHYLLHYKPGSSTKNEKTDDSKSTTTKADSTTVAQINCHQNPTARIMFRMIPILVYGPRGTFEVLAFIDEGSSVSLIEKDLADNIGFDGPSKDLCLGWTGEIVKKEPSSKNLSFYVSSKNGGQKFKLREVRTMNGLNLPLQSLSLNALRAYTYLEGLPICTYDSTRPKILIGLNNYDVCSSLETREGGPNEPIASRTRLGWTIFGRNDNSVNHEDVVQNYHICGCGEEDLHSIVKDYIFSDSLGVKTNAKPIRSNDDIRALEIMRNTTKKVGECYETGLLWRSDDIRLPNSLPMARRRLYCLESKMKKDEELRCFLRKQISDYLDAGYIRKLIPEEVSNGPRSWFLPIFTVKNPNKNKMRVVWDAAAKVNGVSLNSALLKGPDESRSLFGILLRFREERIAICGDIEQMFHRVKIRREDQQAQQFLWRDGDETREPDVYAMQVMTFGATCSPSLAQYVKNSHAEQFSNHPRAVEAIVHNHYVDDWLDCTRTEDEMLELVRNVTKIHAAGGFRIRNWVTNSPRIRQAIKPRDDIELKNFESDSLIEKVLGLWWNPGDDHFTFKLNTARFPTKILNGELSPTKRQVLRLVMTVFDPLGFLTFFLVNAKILLQDIWRAGTDWDEQISADLHEKWNSWTCRLNAIANVQVPRCFPTAYTNTHVQLHMFVDASIHAYAAVSYLRVERDGFAEVALIGSKSKVAPQKPTSIPRLELMAAVLGGRFSRTITDEMKIKIGQRIFWSDSRNVLSWIKSDARNFKQFVALRIAELLDTSDANEWRWVPTAENVADEATKWSSNPEIDPESRWFRGPAFLRQPESEWPTSNEIPDKSNTERLFQIDVIPYSTISPDISRFSNWLRLKRCTAYALRFVNNARSKRLQRDPETGPLKYHQLLQAEYLLFKSCQWDCFPEEMAVLSKRPPGRIDKSSRLRTYNPYVDEHGVLRAHGRIDYIEGVAVDVKRPIILPYEHPLTKLVVHHYHLRFYHRNNEIVVTELRQRFAIFRLRTLVQKVRSNCQLCKNLRALPDPPQMSSLPADRLDPYTKPFSSTGVDHLGPVEVTSGESAGKRWIVLFTCLTTRAVHLEVANSLSTDTFLMNLKTFMGRRGPVYKIYSDQATNFRGANRELKAAIRRLDQKTIMDEFSEIKWFFNPPGSPHMGGVWERLVRSVKSCITDTFRKQYPSDPVLYTSMVEIENILNSRPLTYVPLDHEDETPITPNHFLIGRAGGIRTWGEPKNDGTTIKRNWRICEALANRFWKRWVREFLPTLTRRSKWFDQTKPLEVDDVVIIIDENAPRNQWKKGIIVDVNRGRDNIVRSAVVRTSGGFFTRPAVRLAVLDVKPKSTSG